MRMTLFLLRAGASYRAYLCAWIWTHHQYVAARQAENDGGMASVIVVVNVVVANRRSNGDRRLGGIMRGSSASVTVADRRVGIEWA